MRSNLHSSRIANHAQRLRPVSCLLFCLLVQACGVAIPEEEILEHTSSADLQVDPRAFADDAAVQSDLQLTMARIAPFSSQSAQGLDPRLLLGLADCNCAQEKFASKYMAQLVTRGGPMPQLLMPMVREGVAADPKVQRLLQMPPAYRSVLDGLVSVDNVIKKQVKATVAGKVSAALTGGSTIADRYDFRFDGFAGAGLGPLTAPQTFSIGDQATRWNYILGMDAMWSGKPALDGVDHGLQLLNTALVLSEWSYLYGLDVASKDGTPYGGLTFQTDKNSPSNLYGLAMAPFDPRKDTAGMRFVTGAYTIGYPAVDSLEMATEVQETWRRAAGTVTLDEQALVWRAAARAMARLRPAARTTTAGLYAKGTGIFPADAHTASLLFMPGMDLLLDGPFFSTAAQSVRDEANFARRDDGTFDPGGYPDIAKPVFNEARVLGLARISSALSEWVGQIASLDDLQIDETTASRLKVAHKRLRDPVRLAIVVMMRELPTDLGGVGEAGKLSGRTGMSIGAAGEILFHVVRTLTVGLDSAFLRTRAFAMMDHFAVNYLIPVWRDPARRAEMSSTDIVWIHNALAVIETVEGSAERYPWLPKVRSVFAKAIEDWNNRL